MKSEDHSKDIPIPPARVWEHINQEHAANVLLQLVKVANEIYLNQQSFSPHVSEPARPTTTTEAQPHK